MMEAKNKSKIIGVLGAIFIIAFIGALIYFLYELENQVSERNVVIENLQRENEELKSRTGNIYLNGKTITVDELIKYSNSLTSTIDSVKRRQRMLEFAIKKYDIKINESKSKDGESYSVEAPKVDSALMLLPHYRDMIERKNDSVWMITGHKK